MTFEGPDGGGKTTQLRQLVVRLREEGYPLIATREPGGTRIGEEIRDLIHDCAHTEMTSRAEILLYSASRAQLTNELILPALDAGKLVLCDRYFDSTYAYQGYGRGLSMEELQTITQFATQGLKPDLTVCLDLPPELGIQRRHQSGEALNRLDREALDFHRRVREGYLALADKEPERWIIVDASHDLEEVQQTIWATLEPLVQRAITDGRLVLGS